MVGWQQFVGLVFEVADEKGVQFSGIEDGAEAMEVASNYWNQVDGIKSASEAEARKFLEENL